MRRSTITFALVVLSPSIAACHAAEGNPEDRGNSAANAANADAGANADDAESEREVAVVWSPHPDPAFAPEPGDRPIPSTAWAAHELVRRVERVVIRRETPTDAHAAETLHFNRFGQLVRIDYDDQDTPHMLATLDDEGRVFSFERGDLTTENLEYDDRVRVLRYRETLAHHRGGPDRVTEYRLAYDDQGRISRREQIKGPTIVTTQLAYDDDGDVISETTGNNLRTWAVDFSGARKRRVQATAGPRSVEIIDRKSGRPLSIEQGGMQSVWTYLEFDDAGNWTVRELQRGDAHSRQVRAITYFVTAAPSDE